MKKNPAIIEKNHQKDLKDQEVEEIVPKNDEYYTIDLKRGKDTDVNDIPDIDIAGNNPMEEIDTQSVKSSIIEGTVIKTTSDMQPNSSNSGGNVKENDSIDENESSGSVPGEPGHWGVDQDAG